MDIDAGIEAWKNHDWATAYETLLPLLSSEAEPEHLEALADSAWWVAKIDDTIAARERAFSLYSSAKRDVDAARVAINVAENHAHRLESSEASGWMRRAHRLLDQKPETAELGHLRRLESVLASSTDDAIELAREVQRIGEVTGDLDLQMLGLHDEGRFLLHHGEMEEGYEKMEEAMVSAVAGELTPLITGRIFCNMIETCTSVADYKRAGEWSDRTIKWCEELGHAGGYPGVCRVRRSEIMRLGGDWPNAEAEASRAVEELGDFGPYMAEAFNELGLLRLHRGDLEGADEAFRRAHSLGTNAMPGLALLRMAGGDADAALQMLASVLEGSESPLSRARLLPAAVEIAIEAARHDEASAYAEDLAKLAADIGSEVIGVFAIQAEGKVAAAEGRHKDAVSLHRRALESLQRLGLPFEAARSRCDLGFSLMADGQDALAQLELDLATEELESLGAVTALDWLRSRTPDKKRTHAVPAMMFTDIVDSTRILEVIGDDAWADLVSWHDRMLRSLIADHEGREVDHAGDGFFAAFDSTSEAAHCAVDIQRALSRQRRETGFSPRVRVGIHTGTVLEEDERLLGHNVHLAARIGAAAAGDEILVSGEAIEAIESEFAFANIREVELKGLDKPQTVGSLNWDKGLNAGSADPLPPE